MSVIPPNISFDDIKSEAVDVSNEVKKTDMGRQTDFFIKQVMTNAQREELDQMDITIHKKVAQAPVNAKPVKKKRQLSEKQLQHLANMRAKKAAKRKAQQPQAKPPAANPQPQAAPAPAPVQSKPQKTDDEKVAKRARKRQEMKDYFNELYSEKEKVRMTAKEKRRAEKKTMNENLVRSGRIQVNNPAPAPAPTPTPAPQPQGRKRLRWNNGVFETYYE